MDQQIRKLPAVTGSGREADKFYISRDVDAALQEAEATADNMHDDFVSVEHLFLALLTCPDGTLKQLFATYQLQRKRFCRHCRACEATSGVTTDNPEDTYEALEKYGTDLVRRARDKKMDPVIGRDDEIRNVIRILSRKTKNNPVLIG